MRVIGLALRVDDVALGMADAGVTVMATAVLMGRDIGGLGGPALGVATDSDVEGRPSSVSS